MEAFVGNPDQRVGLEAPSVRAGRFNKSGWTEIADLVAILRRRWRSGRYLRAYARGERWEPISLAIKGPAPGELLDRFEEVRDWAGALVAAAGDRCEIVHKSVGGRNVGSNRLPSRVRITTFDQLCSLLGTRSEVRVLDDLLEKTRREMPALLAWAVEHPLVLLDHRSSWDRVIAVVAWIAATDTRDMYIRQIDVEGVDTKFIEGHQRLFCELLPLVLPVDQVESRPAEGAGDFARRFGFLTKPSYTRFRFLDMAVSPFPPGFTELTARTAELARMDPGVDTVFIIENEVTYLAFPGVPRAMAVFGSGFASTGLAALDWLDGKEIVYWGDIDTHGFDILSRLRSRLPGVRSILMDEDTLLSHRSQWAVEESPTRRELEGLTAEEQLLYRDLVADRYGAGVRLEQERIPFSRVRRALSSALPISSELLARDA